MPNLGDFLSVQKVTPAERRSSFSKASISKYQNKMGTISNPTRHPREEYAHMSTDKSNSLS
jgi:hypothetical protein